MEHEAGAQVVGHGPADHGVAEGIQHDSEVQESGSGRDVGDVRDLEPIGCIGGDVALNQIPCRSGARIPYRRPHPLAAAHAPQAGTAHQTCDPLATHGIASSDELGTDAWCAVGPA